MADFTYENFEPVNPIVDGGFPDVQQPLYFALFSSPDLVGPTVGNEVPSLATTLTTNQAAQFDVTDIDGAAIQRIVVMAHYPVIAKSETVHNGTAFGSQHLGGSNTKTAITDGFRFTILRDGGWPDTSVEFRVVAYDFQGNEVSTTKTWNTTPVAPNAVPVVGNPVPSLATLLGSNDALQFDVTDVDSSFKRIIIAISYPTDYEVVHDGTAFTPDYSSGPNTKTSIANGFRFTVVRDSGWTGTPVTVKVFAYDVDNNETVGTLAWNATPIPGGGPLDTNPPVISNITPPAGLIPGSRPTAEKTPIAFDVTDVAPGIAIVVLSLKYANDRRVCVVHDGTAFVYPFDSSDSVRTPIANGFHYVVLPRGGWVNSFDLTVYAVDSHGNVIS